MRYKICQVIFSTNRLEYLIPTLVSQKNLNFYNCDVDKIFFDDFPATRNNQLITDIVKTFGYNEIYLHENNQGLSATWTEFWNLIKDRDYDYVFHQEDDVEILEPVLISDLIELLNKDQTISQAVLSRQAWYGHEKDPEPESTDLIYKNFRYNKNGYLFSPMASLYPHKITKYPYKQFYNYNLNEGMIGQVLYEIYKMKTAIIKNYYGKNIVKHIGDWFVGKRVLPGEPGYEQFSHYDPIIKYDSKTGALFK